MRQMKPVRQLKNKFSAVKRQLYQAEIRNNRLIAALEYYAKARNHLGWVAPGTKVAKEALRD